ncbi:MAG: class I SAM-dependent methyltransferase [Clostridiales bacterium]|nr:class I SAM-dependent methyltransferase [Clostridiales bacterium]MDD6106851.1 class I SAM-dependent methyltransferase [Clostridiales bacterium]MDD6935511.1 class I SAM-dependent methyltransferase [Clostridiales bacterium]MDY2961543.1 class I SAM-dependent methyltransferase [Oscillospiraceae bacterium]
MNALLHEIEQYWTRRAESYSEVVQYEMTHENEANWMRVIEENLPQSRDVKILDIGTGPGFFAIGLAKRGYDVTAVDYTQAMLDEAMRNAGPYRDRIRFLRMDAHSLDFADNTFDAIVTRNLTWNLERPQDAYNDWCRVLKPGGILLNFDAGWYTYLFDEQKQAAFQADRANVAALGVIDHNDYCESDRMEEISRSLILSRSERPKADVQMLGKAGFRSVRADTEIWKRTWDDVEKVNFASTPLFLLCAQK